ncbi:MAG: sugar ABC transporter substrate-binding protein [Blautia sp.]|nr:sugar ABC transporter substrate-binding protein [Blautia sp.]
MKKTGILILCLIVLTSTWVVAAIENEGQESAVEHEPRLFGSTYMTRNNPFFDVLHRSLEEVVEENGDILITRDPLQDQNKQNEQILEMLEEGIEMLFLNPVDWETVQPALEACEKAGIPVINIDTRVKDQDYVITCIETDNYQAGQECAKDMMKRLDAAEIVILDNPIQTSITDRVRGFVETFADDPDYKIVYEAPAAGELEVGARVMSEFLSTGVSFNVVFGGNDPSALGGLSALQQHKKDEGVLVYGVDGSPDFKAMLEMGYVTGTSSQSPRNLGRTAGETAYAYLQGREIPKYISLPSRLISEDNLNEYEINGWQ